MYKATLQIDGSLALCNAAETRLIRPAHVAYPALMRLYSQRATISLAVTHAPAGYTHAHPLVIEGQQFVGGEFVPAAVVAEATPEEKRELHQPGPEADSGVTSRDDTVIDEGEFKAPQGYGGHPWKGGTPDYEKAYQIPLNELNADPVRFQFKQNVNKSGVTDEFKDTEIWDSTAAGTTLVWKDPANGKTYIVNGHHRYEIAGRAKFTTSGLGDDVQPGGPSHLNAIYIKAKDAQEARAIGAKMNIQEGRGTPMDAAKFMRDTGLDAAAMKSRGVALKGKLVAEAVVLATLNNRLFNDVAAGKMKQEEAVAIAKHLPDHNLQDQLANFLKKKKDKGKAYDAKIVEGMGKEMADTPTHTTSERTLFGDIESEDSLFGERNELKAAVRADLSQAVNDFKAGSSDRRAEVLAEHGNILDVEQNRKLAGEHGQSLAIFDKLVNSRGPISDALNEGAKEQAKAKGKKAKDAARNNTVAAVQRAVELEASRTAQRGSEGPRVSGVQEAPIGDAPAGSPAGDAGSGEAVGDGLKGADAKFYAANLPTAKQKQTIREDVAMAGARLGKDSHEIFNDLVLHGSDEKDASGAVKYAFKTIYGQDVFPRLLHTPAKKAQAQQKSASPTPAEIDALPRGPFGKKNLQLLAGHSKATQGHEWMVKDARASAAKELADTDKMLEQMKASGTMDTEAKEWQGYADVIRRTLEHHDSDPSISIQSPQEDEPEADLPPQGSESSATEANLPEGWDIKPTKDGKQGLYREGRETPVATAATSEELHDKVAGVKRPSAKTPVDVATLAKSEGHLAFVGRHEFYRKGDKVFKATIGSKIGKTGDRNGNLSSESEMVKAKAKSVPSSGDQREPGTKPPVDERSAGIPNNLEDVTPESETPSANRSDDMPNENRPKASIAETTLSEYLRRANGDKDKEEELRASHWTAVKNAHDRGVSLPDAVMRDYPNLKDSPTNDAALKHLGVAVPTEAKPKEPKFTGVTTDSLGREYHWVDGVRVPGPAEPETAEASELEEITAQDWLAEPHELTKDKHAATHITGDEEGGFDVHLKGEVPRHFVGYDEARAFADEEHERQVKQAQAGGLKLSANPHIALAEHIAERLRSKETITAADLFAAADTYHGGTRAEGKYGPSEAYDSLEAGFNMALKGQTDPTASLEAALGQVEELAEGVARLPTQTNRSGNKDSFQQFSTPPHLAFAVTWLANLKPTDTVLEPSAGVGGITVHAANTGAHVIANEKDTARVAFLKHQLGSKNVYQEDGEQLGAIMPAENVHPTVVVMNPPFSQTAGRMGDKKILMTGANHITQALQTLEPGGRLVSIVAGGFARGDRSKPAGMSMDAATYKEWFRNLARDGYTLRANVGVPGDEYKKYGTNFGTRTLVIDKVPPEDAKPIIGEAKDVPDLMRMLEGVRNDRPTIAESSREPTSVGLPEASEGAAESEDIADPDIPPDVLGSTAEEGILGQEQHAGGTPGAGDRTTDSAAGTGGSALGSGLREPASGFGGGIPDQPVGGAEPASGQHGGEPAPVPKPTRSRKAAGGVSKGVSKSGIVGNLRPAIPITYLPLESSTSALLASNEELGQSLYEPYKPQLMRVQGVKPHINPLVESAAMSAVSPPVPTYRPVLSPDLVESKRVEMTMPDGTKKMRFVGLSDHALEAVVYAGQAHEQFLKSKGGTSLDDGMELIGPNGERATIIFSSNRWPVQLRDANGMISGWDSVDEARVALADGKWTNTSNEPLVSDAFRRGYFIGDGTGSGKGREIAGIIADNTNRGRKLHVWISETQDLIAAASRDVADMGMDPNSVFDFNKAKGANPPKEGVLYMTYGGLRSKPTAKADAKEAAAGNARKKPNVDQLIDYLGPDFDGVIALDECHNLGNAMDSATGFGNSQASQTALAAIKLQKSLPKARVVYVSATGATEVRNLAYAERLGIWGKGTAFANKQEFVGQMEAGGTAAMEAVAQSLKATGTYTARALGQDDNSGKENTIDEATGRSKGDHKVDYVPVTHHLTEEQAFNYDAAADAWQVVLQNIDKAIEAASGGPGVAKPSETSHHRGAARSQFFGAQLRFYDQFMTSMQTPTVIAEMEKDLATGQAPVVALVNTMKAATDRAIAAKGPEEGYEDLDVSPKEILITFLKKSFPTTRLEKQTDADGNVTMVPVMRPAKNQDGSPALDDKGKPIMEELQDPTAVKMRDEMLDNVQLLHIPDAPLDMILKHFGHDKVSEMTGRNFRIRPDEKGEQIKEKRGKGTNEVELERFQNGTKQIAIASAAGLTGLDYHADKNVKNQGRRRMYLLQPGWRADKAVQAFGRVNRTNQASFPTYSTVQIAELKGQKRFITSIARRLEQLGALGKGQRQTGGGGVFSAADNLESKEAVEALDHFFNDLNDGRVEGLHAPDVLKQLGLQSEAQQQAHEGGDDRPTSMTQFLNRILCLRIGMQNKVFEAYDTYLKQYVEAGLQNGTLDTGVSNFPAQKIVKNSDDVVYSDQASGATTRHVTVTASVKNEKRSWNDLMNMKAFGGIGQAGIPIHDHSTRFVRQKANGKVYAVTQALDRTDSKTGQVIPQYRTRGIASSDLRPKLKLDAMNSTFENISYEDAKDAWDQEYDNTADTIEQEEHFIAGALLPVWDKIPGYQPKIYRLRTSTGETIVARHVARKDGDFKDVDEFLKKVGAAPRGQSGRADHHAPAAVHAKLEKRAVKATLANGWKLKPSLVQGEWRIELTGPGGYQSKDLVDDGVFRERIGGLPRFFIPTGDVGAQVLDKITGNNRITDVTDMDGNPISLSAAYPTFSTDVRTETLRALRAMFPLSSYMG